METTATMSGERIASKAMIREVKLDYQYLKKLFVRYHHITEALHLLESHPLTPQMEITLRLRRHKEWLNNHISSLLKAPLINSERPEA